MNVAQLIHDHADDRVALVSQGRSMTYAALRAEVDQARARLGAIGVGAGERVALLCGNNSSFVVSYLAVVGLGAIAVPLNPASPAPELAAQVAAVEAATVLVAPAAAPTWASVNAADVPSVVRVVGLDGAELAGALDLRTIETDVVAPIVEPEPGAVAVLAFTSGTAGSPRAACLTHENLLSNISQSRSQNEGRRIEATDVVYCVLPLHHIFGLNVVLGNALAAGATTVVVQRFDPSTALDTIVERQVTVVPGAPPMWVEWANLQSVPPDAFSSVRLALSGAAKLPEETAHRLRDRFGVEVAEGYGLTEAGPIVTSSAGLPFHPGSIGRVLPGMQVRLVDDTGGDVLRGDPGEIWVKGPNVFAGYWHDDEATARALGADGWLRTGDIAVTDDDGNLFLVDRAKDLVIVSGFNVFPAEVEEVLAEHPGVAEVAVVGVPHPHTGEAVKAYVVALDGVVLDEDQLIAHCADHLARYKCPTKILFVDQLPRGASGKLLRRALDS